MRIVGKSDFTEVVEIYRGEHCAHGAEEGVRFREGEDNLRRGDALSGTWTRVRLSRADLTGVTLPWHLSEGGERELVPRTGLTVAQAAARVRTERADLLAANPVCTELITALADAPLTTVFLSTAPVDHSDYADLRADRGLFHLDGLHRMIAWELAGRLPEEETIDAIVAGDFRDGGSPR
ncbi:DUF6309 family protein [Nocardia sp. NPDC050378]|uniref:DUF6309 family protein n=1 Tax=Nocardia sp. NPDC050378 TaxID=3155400 RepID=UPI0033D17F24